MPDEVIGCFGLSKKTGRIRSCHCADIGLQTLLHFSEVAETCPLSEVGCLSFLSTVHNQLLLLKMLPFSGQTSLHYLYLQNVLILMQVNLAIVKRRKVETRKMGYLYFDIRAPYTRHVGPQV